jgi:hypothetical protein
MYVQVALAVLLRVKTLDSLYSSHDLPDERLQK